MKQVQVWKYAKHGRKDVLGIIKDNTVLKEVCLSYKEEYDIEVKNFRSLEKNHSSVMYEKLSRLVELGRKINPEKFTIKQLCIDVGITYCQYKFYMKFYYIDDGMKYLIDTGKIQQNIVMNIIHRFPEKDWNFMIEKQLKYKLTKNDLVHLKTNDKYKDDKEWDVLFDKRGVKRGEHFSFTNKRSILTWCKNLCNQLGKLECYNEPTKKKIFSKIYETHYKLGVWLQKHDEWK